MPHTSLAGWLDRRLLWLVGALAVTNAIALVLIAVLFVQLAQARDDIDRVESGAALAGLRLEAFRAQLDTLQPVLSSGLDEAITGLESFRSTPLEFTIEVDESVPFDQQLPIRYDFVVPIETTVPIDESLRTTIDVEGPLGLSVPVDVTVPIDLDVPVATEVVVPVDETLPLKGTVPVQFDVPVRLDPADTGLTAVTDPLLEILVALREALSDLGE